MREIKVGIIGVGNCAKSLIEGVSYYTKNRNDTIGLIHPMIGQYHPSSLDFVVAFDIDERKVGKKLHKAIYAQPNKTIQISDPLEYNTVVQRGPTIDSVAEEMREHFIHESDLPVVDVAQALRESGAKIVLNYLPSGSEQATYVYAEAALQAGCSFINCMPTPIAKSKKWQKRFHDANLILIGDDIKSQVGATILNRTVLNLLKIRGVRITKAEQINYGGNADHFNLHHRPKAKEKSKQAALKSVLDKNDARPTARMIYTEKNYDHKRAEIKIEGMTYGNIPVSLTIILEDEDSPNSAGVVIDATRLVKVLLDKKKQHKAGIVSAYLFKAPLYNKSLSEFKVFEILHEFIKI